MTNDEIMSITEYVIRLFVSADLRIRCTLSPERPRIMICIPLLTHEWYCCGRELRLEWDSPYEFIEDVTPGYSEPVFLRVKTLLRTSIGQTDVIPKVYRLLMALSTIDTVGSLEELKLKLAVNGIADD